MAINATCVLGNTYAFEQCDPYGVWNDVPLIYMFASWNGWNWVVYYIGQCDSAKNRLSSHERWDEAARLGATHVLARVVLSSGDRDSIERALIQSHNPPLNTHYRPVGALFGLAG